MLLGEKNEDSEVEGSLFSGCLKAWALPWYNLTVAICSQAALTEMSQVQMSRLPLLFACQDSHGMGTKRVASRGSTGQLLKRVGVGQHVHRALRNP